MAKIDWLTAVSAAENKADEGAWHHGWELRGIEWTRLLATLLRAEYITLVSQHNAVQERIAAGTIPALPELTDRSLKRRDVTLLNLVPDESATFAVDYWTDSDDTSECDAIDVNIAAVWSGANDIGHWLDEDSHTSIRLDIAKQLRAEHAEHTDQRAATAGYLQQNEPAAELTGA